MANVRIQPSRALTVIKSDDADVPYPGINTTGTDTAGNLNQLVDNTKDFVALNVYTGDIVYNTTTGASATIINNPITSSSDTLELNASIMNNGDDYVIYQSSPQAGGQNTGCVLYVGGKGDVKVTTAGNDIITLVNIQDGTFIPVQVIKVWSATTATDIIALW